MADWYVNRGLVPCIESVRGKFPGIVIGTIGDEAHRKEKSDHNPNLYSRVNAADYMLGKGGFDHAAAERLCADLIKDPRTKYVIYNRRIWESDTRKWLKHTGSNPHTDHVHHSVHDWADVDRTEWNFGMNADDVWEKQVPTSPKPKSAQGALAENNNRIKWMYERMHADWSKMVNTVTTLESKVASLESKIDELRKCDP